MEERSRSEGQCSTSSSYEKLYPGRRLTTTLGDDRSKVKYRRVAVLDFKDDSTRNGRCVVFMVPEDKANEWLYSQAEGQWQIASTVKACRLIVVILKGHRCKEDSQKELSRLVISLLPSGWDTERVDFCEAADGVSFSEAMHSAVSKSTGEMLVENVVYKDDRLKSRRLLFQRNPNLIQSEAFLMIDPEAPAPVKTAKRQARHPKRYASQGKKKAKGKQKAVPRSHMFDHLVVDHSRLCNPYHVGMISAFLLFASRMERWLASKQQMRVMVAGLGSGALPMFLHKCLPMTDVQIVELDEMVGDLAERYFGFVADGRMRLHIRDGVAAVQDIASAASSMNVQERPGETDVRLHVLMIDTDSKNPSDGLSCPAPEFMEDVFMEAAIGALLDEGVLIMNLVAVEGAHHKLIRTQLDKYFKEVYEMHVSDGSWVLIAMPKRRDSPASTHYSKGIAEWEEKISMSTLWGHVKQLSDSVRDMVLELIGAI